jgi:hypothetical protein
LKSGDQVEGFEASDLNPRLLQRAYFFLAAFFLVAFFFAAFFLVAIVVLHVRLVRGWSIYTKSQITSNCLFDVLAESVSIVSLVLRK